MAIRVLIVDGQTLVRQAIVTVLSEDRAIEIVGEASNGFEALSKTRELKPDVILMDLAMPGMDGATATRLIKRELPEMCVVLLTSSDDEADVALAAQSGARSFMSKRETSACILKQVKEVAVAGAAVL